MHGRAMQELLPDLIENSRVFYLTCAFPPVPAGSSVINRNLLSKFNPESFKVFTTKANINAMVEGFQDLEINRVFKSFYFSSRLNFYLSKAQINSAVKKVIKSAEKDKPEVLVGVFPDYYFLKITRDAAKELQIPFVAYLHDTISESAYGGKLYKDSLKLQDLVFEEASAILVMSDGMRDLYKEKYNIESMPLQHTYLEDIRNDFPEGDLPRRAFWGGDIYGINLSSVRRVSNALRKNDYRFFLATGFKKDRFAKMNFDITNIEIGFFSKRKEYLENLTKSGILVLALDWPDESHVHRDELATIFPTKTPEYLAAGVPIIVHCPEDYFMAKFFKDNDCGFVVSERSEEAISDAISVIHSGMDEVIEKRRNALMAAKIFDSDELAGKFKNVLKRVSESTWGKTINYEDL